MKRFTIALTAMLAVASLSSAANAAVISYWNENTVAFPDGTFGYTPSSFPQAPNAGNGSLNLANFDTTTGGANGAYTYIASFSGTTTNAQFGDPSGGSLSPLGGADNGGVFSNNGMQILISTDTTGYNNINLSWAQRGTSTGFTSRAFEYSTNGGGSYTPLAFTGDTGVLSATFTTVSPNLTGITALENNPNVVFRLTLGGATSGNGNNRFDNIVVQGTEIPEPATLGLLMVAGLAFAASRRRNG
jgi:hypothetical protein